MARPRVIVADTDESYVIPLQKKFAELFADKIDLEIITDKDYFNQLFSLSQHADILLVSDTLYNSGLKKHDIRHLMILSEHYEPGQTDELDICRLFKYTSVREIFNEITGRCKDTLYAEQDAGKETKIILITSASGGVGKTSVAFGLCRCLERNYKKKHDGRKRKKRDGRLSSAWKCCDLKGRRAESCCDCQRAFVGCDRERRLF